MMKKTFIEYFSRFNDDQKAALNTVVGTVFHWITSEAIIIGNNDIYIYDYVDFELTLQTKCFMINANGGTGKDFVLNFILEFLKLQKKKVIVVASSTVVLYCMMAQLQIKTSRLR